MNSSKSAPAIGVVDYGSGNLRSVCKAFEVCGAQVSLVTSTSQLDACDGLVVPGQGSFHDCAQNLRASGLWDSIKGWIAADRPFLGICVGYQLLFESSEESPGVEGLGIFDGIVRRFPHGALKVPHMGWNTLTLNQPDDVLYRDVPVPTEVYFVHSYFPDPADTSIVSATCDYGGPFAASVSRGALSATQFHPEKSQRTGLAILRNFLTSLPANAPAPSH